MTYRVVQWNTGNVGTQTALAILKNPHLELVGCYAWSPEKSGLDVGQLLECDATGIRTTNSIDDVLALKPDCVCYTPLWPDVDQLCTLLSAGINIVTTAHFITGQVYLGDDKREKIIAACNTGNSAIMGTGMHPGFSNMMTLAATAACNRVDKIIITESQDASGYASEETQRSVGFDSPMDAPGLSDMVRDGSLVFAESLYMMAEALKFTLDRVEFHSEFAPSTKDCDLGFMKIRKGHVAGVAGRWHGIVNDKIILDIGFKWKMGSVDESWKIEHAYLLEIQGFPTLKIRTEILPPRDFVAHSLKDYMQLGMVITGLPAVNAIPAICQASSGIHSYPDLPLTPAAGFVTV